MTGEEIVVWLSNIYGGEPQIQDIEGRRLAFASLADGTRAVTTCGFSSVDTGLALDVDRSTDVRCEIVIASDSATDAELAAAVVGIWNKLESSVGIYPAQPGTVVPNFVAETPLATLADITVKHAVLRAPQMFERGTPSLTEEGRVTLLLEIVLLTEEEYAIALDQGFDRFSTRLRRRATNLGDFRRDGE